MSSSDPSSRSAFYKRLAAAAESQLSTTPSSDPLPMLSNLASLIYHSFIGEFGGSSKTSVNWCGFYLVRQIDLSSTSSNSADSPSSPVHDPDHPPPSTVLLLGPFHGLPAVSLIRIGKGVCGTAVAERATQVVPDVHAHPNHIACDSASNSEIVIPVFSDETKEKLVGVLDIDSPLLNFFSTEDQQGLEPIVNAFGFKIDWKMFDKTIKVKLPGQKSNQDRMREAKEEEGVTNVV